MNVEASKFLISTTKILIVATKFLVSAIKFKSADQKIGIADQKFGSPNQNFGSADQKIWLPQPTLLLVGLAKNKGQPNQIIGQPNQIAIWLSQPSQKVGSAYKISMSVRHFKIYFVDNNEK